MFSQSFSLKSLAHLLRRSEGYRYGYRGKRKAVKGALSPTVQALNEARFAYEALNTHPTAKGNIFSTKHLGSALVQRKLNENIKVLYKVKQSNRDLIIRQIRALLSEPLPKHIIKVDIEKFYESVPRDGIIKKMLSDQLLSIDSKNLLRLLYSHEAISDEHGLHRGLCTSASISELYMRGFDRRAHRLDGVYYYARYVDDIIIFCYKEPRKIFDSIERMLNNEYGLSLNHKKSGIISVESCICRSGGCVCPDKAACRCKGDCTCKRHFKEHQEHHHYPPRKTRPEDRGYFNFNYLGYKFYFPPIVQDPKNKCRVFLTIADKKVAKIKSRIAHSIIKFEADHNYQLLRDRIMFLTSNYRISSRKGAGLYAGIFYSYRYLDLPNEKARTCRQHDALDDLDNYVRNILFCQRTCIGRKARGKLTSQQKKELASFTFKQGWQKRFFSRFSQKEINAITKAWIYEKN